MQTTFNYGSGWEVQRLFQVLNSLQFILRQWNMQKLFQVLNWLQFIQKQWNLQTTFNYDTGWEVEGLFQVFNSLQFIQRQWSMQTTFNYGTGWEVQTWFQVLNLLQFTRRQWNMQITWWLWYWLRSSNTVSTVEFTSVYSEAMKYANYLVTMVLAVKFKHCHKHCFFHFSKIKQAQYFSACIVDQLSRTLLFFLGFVWDTCPWRTVQPS